MKHILLLVSINFFPFPFVKSINSTFDSLVSSTDSNLSKYYEKLAKDYISEHLSGKNFENSVITQMSENFVPFH